MSFFPCSISFKKYVYVIRFAHVFFDEKLSHDLGIKKILWDKFDKIFGIIFWKMFPFGLTVVNKVSHKNDLVLSHFKP